MPTVPAGRSMACLLKNIPSVKTSTKVRFLILDTLVAENQNVRLQKSEKQKGGYTCN